MNRLLNKVSLILFECITIKNVVLLFIILSTVSSCIFFKEDEINLLTKEYVRLNEVLQKEIFYKKPKDVFRTDITLRKLSEIYNGSNDSLRTYFYSVAQLDSIHYYIAMSNNVIKNLDSYNLDSLVTASEALYIAGKADEDKIKLFKELRNKYNTIINQERKLIKNYELKSEKLFNSSVLSNPSYVKLYEKYEKDNDENPFTDN
jgi:hypothetical protein